MLSFKLYPQKWAMAGLLMLALSTSITFQPKNNESANLSSSATSEETIVKKVVYKDKIPTPKGIVEVQYSESSTGQVVGTIIGGDCQPCIGQAYVLTDAKFIEKTDDIGRLNVALLQKFGTEAADKKKEAASDDKNDNRFASIKKECDEEFSERSDKLDCYVDRFVDLLIETEDKPEAITAKEAESFYKKNISNLLMDEMTNFDQEFGFSTKYAGLLATLHAKINEKKFSSLRKLILADQEKAILLQQRKVVEAQRQLAFADQLKGTVHGSRMVKSATYNLGLATGQFNSLVGLNLNSLSAGLWGAYGQENISRGQMSSLYTGFNNWTGSVIDNMNWDFFNAEAIRLGVKTNNTEPSSLFDQNGRYQPGIPFINSGSANQLNINPNIPNNQTPRISGNVVW